MHTIHGSLCTSVLVSQFGMFFVQQIKSKEENNILVLYLEICKHPTMAHWPKLLMKQFSWAAVEKEINLSVSHKESGHLLTAVLWWFIVTENWFLWHAVQPQWKSNVCIVVPNSFAQRRPSKKGVGDHEMRNCVNTEITVRVLKIMTAATLHEYW